MPAVGPKRKLKQTRSISALQRKQSINYRRSCVVARRTGCQGILANLSTAAGAGLDKFYFDAADAGATTSEAAGTTAAGVAAGALIAAGAVGMASTAAALPP